MRIVIILVLTASLAAFAQTNEPGTPPQGPGGPGQGREPGGRPGVGGTITAISGDSLTLKTMDGRIVTVKLNDKTRFRKDRQDAKLSDFKVGDTVMVRGEQASDGTILAAGVMARSGAGAFTGTPQQFREGLGKQFIAGEIKSIDGLKLTIARVDGETQTIAVDENTSFRKQGESVTLADLKPGDHVFGRGEVKDGVFVPAVLNVGQPGGMRGRPPQGPAPEQSKQ